MVRTAHNFHYWEVKDDLGLNPKIRELRAYLRLLIDGLSKHR